MLYNNQPLHVAACNAVHEADSIHSLRAHLSFFWLVEQCYIQLYNYIRGRDIVGPYMLPPAM